MRSFLVIGLIVLLSDNLQGQAVSVGVKGGVRLTDSFGTNTAALRDAGKRYVVGPAVEVALSLGLRLEVDALYRRLGDDIGYSFLDRDDSGRPVEATVFRRFRGWQWEVPVLLLCRLPSLGGLRPFVSGGYALRVQGGDVSSRQVIDGVERQFRFAGDTTTGHGVVVAGGVRRRLGLVTLAPELRYTRWTDAPVRFSVGRGGGFARANQNQVDFLVGITLP